MKKTLIVATVLGVAVLALGTVGLVYAQGGTPKPSGFGPRGQGMQGEDGPLHEAMTDAMASALGLTPEEFEARHEAGETAYEIALAQGMSADEARGLMINVRSEVMAQAVADGLMTQEQLNLMLSRQASMGAGSGDCDGTGPMGSGNAGHGRFGGSGMRFAPVSP